MIATGVMLAAVWAVSSTPRQLLIPALLALIALVGFRSEATGTAIIHRAIPALATTCFFALIATLLALDVFRPRDRVDSHVIFGAVNVYLLIGLTFAGVHFALAGLVREAIKGLDAGSSFSESIYYSFVTLSTVGYGDFTPTSEGARMLAYVEALTGQLFLAILLARLVALHLAQQAVGDDDKA